MDEEILRKLQTQLTISVPEAGAALGDLCETSSYAEAAETGQIGGCPVIDVGGKRRVPTAFIRRRLGIDQQNGEAA